MLNTFCFLIKNAMSCRKTKVYSQSSSPYGSKGTPFSDKISPYASRVSAFTDKVSAFGALCLDYVVYTFMDGNFYAFQDNTQFIFNLPDPA